MNCKVIKTEAAYQKTIKRAMAIFQAKEGTAEADELALLLGLAPLIGSKAHASSILSGRKEITLKMAQRLRDYFQLPAEIFLPAP